jgi:TolA-binding protein
MTRHELKETDEITNKIQSFGEIALARKREILIGLVAVLVAIIAIGGWSIYSRNQNAAAQMQLAQAINAYTDATKPEKERYEKTLAEAQKTMSAYGSSPAGIIAQYYAGMAHEGLGDTAKATENLQQVIQKGDANQAGVAKFALAGIYKKHGDVQKATDLYKQIYDNGGYSKSAAVFELAKLSEAANKTDEAKTYYQKIVSEFPESPFRQDADQALKRLGVPSGA